VIPVDVALVSEMCVDCVHFGGLEKMETSRRQMQERKKKTATIQNFPFDDESELKFGVSELFNCQQRWPYAEGLNSP
jgi:hypothetical protein